MDLKNKLKIGGASTLIAIAGASVIAPWEGKRNQSYQDVIGVWTICYGETNNVKKGDYKNDDECNQSFALELKQYNKDMINLIKVDIEPHVEVALTSFVWNVGISNFKKSTLLKLLNQNKINEACNELTKWTRSGGLIRKGLVNRRNAELKICLGKDDDINKQLKELKKEFKNDIK